LPAAVYFLYFNSQGKVKRDQTPRVHQSRTSHPDVKESERVGELKPEAEVARLERGRRGKAHHERMKENVILLLLL